MRPQGNPVPSEGAALGASAIAFSAMAMVCLFGVFSAGAPLQASHGIICLVAGMLMLALPPWVPVPRMWWLMAGLFILLCSLPFLPKGLFPAPAWRQAVEALGVNTGPFLTAHPRQTGDYLAGVGITALVALYLLGHRISERSQQRLVLAFTMGVALYAAVCIGVQEQDWKLAWDPQVTFGLLPNRNHTATLLVMGVLTGISCLLPAVRRRQGAMAGMAALALALNTGAVLGYCGSRAGVLLLVLGLGAWVVGLDRSAMSRRVLIAMALFTTAALAVFWLSQSAVKSRLTQTVERIVEASPVAGVVEAEPALATPTGEGDTPLDFRLLVYRDTLRMLAAEPWTGVGLGMFRYVFPQYRNDSISPQIALHPESDWLMMAAEAGLGATLVLVGLVALVLVAAVRQARRRRGWTLRWGSLVAAMIVPVHGLFDVPGHRVGLAWAALFLVALAFRAPDEVARCGRPQQAFFRLAGAAVAVVGAFLVWAEWGGGPPSALAQPDRLAAHARALSGADHGKMNQQTPAGSTNPDEQASDENLRSAIALVDQALAVTPLDPDLHYLKGAVALHFDELDSTVDQAFAAQRLLDPHRAQVPLWQAQGWSGIDPTRTATLWADALDRAAIIESRSRRPETTRSQVWGQILAQAQGQDDLSRRALALAGTDSQLVLTWARQAPPGVLGHSMPSLLAAEPSPAARQALFQAWLSRDRSKAQAFAEGKPDLQDVK